MPLVIEAAQISGAQPARQRQDLPRLLWVAIITCHDVWTAGQNLTYTGLRARCLKVDAHLYAGQRRARGSVGITDRVTSGRGACGGFCHPIAILQCHAIERLRLALPRWIKRGCSARHITQSGRVQMGVTMPFHMRHQKGMHLRHRGIKRDPLLQSRIGCGRIKPRSQTHGCTSLNRRHSDRAQPKHMCNRQNTVDHILRGHCAQPRRRHAAKTHVFMGQHYPFGRASCTRGVEQNGDIWIYVRSTCRMCGQG